MIESNNYDHHATSDHMDYADNHIENKVEITKNKHLSEMKTTAHISQTRSRLNNELKPKKTDKKGKDKTKEDKKEDSMQINTSYKMNTSKNLNLSQNLQNISNIVDLPIFDSESSEVDTVDENREHKHSGKGIFALVKEEVVVLVFFVSIGHESFSLLILYMFILLNSVSQKLKIIKNSSTPLTYMQVIAHSGLLLTFLVAIRLFVWNFAMSPLFKFFISGLLFKNTFMGNFDQIFDKRDKIGRNGAQAISGLAIGIYLTSLTN